MMSIRSMAGRVASAITTDNQRGALREMFHTLKGSSRRGAFAAAAFTAMFSPMILTRSDGQFAQDRDAVLADLAGQAIVLHWHNPDPATRLSFIRGYRDEVFDIPADEIAAYADEHFAELAALPGGDRATMIRAYAAQAINQAQDRADLDGVRAGIASLITPASGISVDDVAGEVEAMNTGRQEKLNDLAIRAAVRNGHGLLGGQMSREQMRSLLQQDGVQNPMSGITPDDVLDYMADHLPELLDHEVFGNVAADRGRVAAAVATLRGEKIMTDEPTLVA